MPKPTPNDPNAPTVETQTEQEPVTTVPESIRAKFQCTSVQDNSTQTEFSQRMHAHPVLTDNVDGSPNENASFAKFTPAGVLELVVSNEAIDGFFESGATYYLDITKVPNAPVDVLQN